MRRAQPPDARPSRSYVGGKVVVFVIICKLYSARSDGSLFLPGRIAQVRPELLPRPRWRERNSPVLLQLPQFEDLRCPVLRIRMGAHPLKKLRDIPLLVLKSKEQIRELIGIDIGFCHHVNGRNIGFFLLVPFKRRR